ncbi:MAG: lipase family protein [Alphaproteobacteria bacterium]|nr:lipase family protein [Alphaproteobacteria bacterium]
MTRAEATGIPYDPSFRALVNPAAAGKFFELHQPQSREAWCAEFARLAYCEDQAVVDSSLKRIGFSLIDAFDHHGTAGLVAEGPAFSVLCFRGSDDVRAWITNLDALPKPWRGGGTAHRGFAAALDAVWLEVEAAIRQVATPLVMTGHSLGGALATLAASLHPVANLVTFGSPRVGDAAFSAAMEHRPGEARRYVNGRDIVCRLPSARLGYRHVGTPWLIDADGRVLQRAPEDEGLAALLSSALETDRLVNPQGLLRRELTDHSPINYVSALR